MCIGKTVFRTALIGGLAVGGATLLLGPERMAAGFDSVQSKVQGVVDGYVEDPVALRRQLQDIADDLPEKIAELEGELGEVNRQIARMEKDSEIARGVVAKTSSQLEDLHTYLAEATEKAANTRKVVQIRFDGRRYDIDEARRAFNRINQIRDGFEQRLEMNQRDLAYLADQRERLAELISKLNQELTTIQGQMWQIDRKIEAIARNEKLVETLEEREEALNAYDTTYDLGSLEALQAKLDKWETEIDARLERFDRQTEWRNYEEEVRWELEQQERKHMLESDFDPTGNKHHDDALTEEDTIVLGPGDVE